MRKKKPVMMDKTETKPQPSSDATNSSASSQTKQSTEEVKAPDPVVLAQNVMYLAERSQKLIQDFLARQANDSKPTTDTATALALPMEAAKAWMETMQALWKNPEQLIESQISLWQDYLSLGRYASDRLLGKPATPLVAPTAADRRFQDTAWQESAVFDVIKQSYLLSARWLQGLVRDAEGLDQKTQQKADFYTRQFVDALSPSNFVITNPEVLRKTVETGGENLLKGFENLLADLEQGGGQLKISMTDPNAFSLGVNIADTPGSVIYQTDMMQLIHYKPVREAVYAVPLLIIPPWINKYYILDLGAKKSFVRFALDQGYQVFMVSWVNPDKRHASKDFASYMHEGLLAALDAINKATGAKSVNAVGYCLGGTLLASTLAWLAAADSAKASKNPACSIASATYLVTLVDFKEPGELGIFIDEDYLNALEASMQEKGYLDAGIMAATFNLLRANDLIWSFVINNYLMGREPFPFDLLYWNADATRMPAAMHSFYLRKMYQQNLLCRKNGLVLDGRTLDLGRITIPSFIVGTSEDHIAPWRGVYAGTQLYKGAVEFVLAGSGHIAGIINPPYAQKYSYNKLVSNPGSLPATPEDWLKMSQSFPGSWWAYWSDWLKPHAGSMIPAVQPAPGIESAPGAYARTKA